jgi:GNAT superfamily N-acetyltransferase
MADILQASLQATLDRIESIILGKRFRLEVGYVPQGTEPEPETFRFAITTVRGERVAVIKTHLSTGDIILGKTRETDIKQDVPAIAINWLGTDEEYRGEGLGILLLIYALCYLKLHNPHINYSILDDDSDRNQYFIGNIYTSLGYVFQDTIALDPANPKKIIISSPDRQLRLDNPENIQEFLVRVNKMLDTKFGKKGGKRKTRKTRKNKRTRKTKQPRKARKARKTKRRL